MYNQIMILLNEWKFSLKNNLQNANTGRYTVHGRYKNNLQIFIVHYNLEFHVQIIIVLLVHPCIPKYNTHPISLQKMLPQLRKIGSRQNYNFVPKTSKRDFFKPNTFSVIFRIQCNFSSKRDVFKARQGTQEKF